MLSRCTMTSICDLRNIEEPAGFNDFQPFVHQRGRVDGNLGAHFPIGMLQRALRRDVLQLLLASEAPERSSGRGENQAADVFTPMAFERLEDGAVFTVDGENADAMLLGFCPASACPAMTIGSLLARRYVFRLRIAAKGGHSPAPPTMAEMTSSASGAEAT